MTISVEIDPSLIEAAREVGGHETREAAIEAALTKYVGHAKRMEILELFGTIDYDPDFDAKAQQYRPCASS